MERHALLLVKCKSTKVFNPSCLTSKDQSHGAMGFSIICYNSSILFNGFWVLNARENTDRGSMAVR